MHPEEPEEKRRRAPNEERDCHAFFRRWGLSLCVRITEQTFELSEGEKADTAYIRVTDWLTYLIKRSPFLIAGGNDPLEAQLEAYWTMYKH